MDTWAVNVYPVLMSIREWTGLARLACLAYELASGNYEDISYMWYRWDTNQRRKWARGQTRKVMYA